MLRREVLLDVSPDQVWRALGHPDGLSEWFGARVEGDVRAGEQVHFHFPDGTERTASIEEVDSERALVFRWLPFERTADGSTSARPVTRVELQIDETDHGTLVVIVERDLFVGSRAAI